MAFPVGWELPPELGQMVFLGAGRVSAASANCQGRLDLSSTQEATRGGGFGEAETLLGGEGWVLWEGARLQAPCLCLCAGTLPLLPACSSKF